MKESGAIKKVHTFDRSIPEIVNTLQQFFGEKTQMSEQLRMDMNKMYRYALRGWDSDHGSSGMLCTFCNRLTPCGCKVMRELEKK